MEKGLFFFAGGVVLVLAFFIPLFVLHDHRVEAAPKSLRSRGRRCPRFRTPQALVGEFVCVQKKKHHEGELHACKLLCPPSLTARPKKRRVLHICHNGRWAIANNDVHCVALKSVSMVEQHSASPKVINTLLTSYLNQSNNYLAMAYFFDRADVHLPGFHKYFLALWQGSLDNARELMVYINKRGGWIDMQSQPRSILPEILHFGHEAGNVGLVAMKTAVGMERRLQKQIIQVIELVETSKPQDPHLLHTLEHTHLEQRVRRIKELTDYLTQLRAFHLSGPGDYELGEYDMDNNLQ